MPRKKTTKKIARSLLKIIDYTREDEVFLSGLVDMTKPGLYKAILATIAAMFCMAAFAQLPDYQLSLIQEQEGLKTADVLNVAKDKEGFLWLATQTGVQRFDGKHTLSFPFQETVNSIYIDSLGRKWVMTRQNVFLFTDAYKRFKRIHFENADEGVSADLYEMTNGCLSAIASGNHYVFDERKQKFLKNRAPHFVNRVSRYLGKSGSNHFFASGDSLFCYRPSTKKVTALYIGRIYRAGIINPEELFVSTTRFETYYVNIQKQEVKPLAAFIRDSPFANNLLLYDMVSIKKDQFLFCSTKGLFQYNSITDSISWPVFYHNGRPLENQASVTSFFKDDGGTVYMNHADGVVFMNNESNFIQYLRNYRFANEQLPDNIIRNFTEDETGNIWMATTNGVVRVNMKNGELKVFEPVDRKNIIDFPSYRQLLNDGPYIWIGTAGNGTWLYDKRTNKYKRPLFAASDVGRKKPEAFEQNYVWKILKLKDGKMLIVGGDRSYISDPVTLLTEEVKLGSSFVSRAAIQDSSGRIWHGTTGGLSCFDPSFNRLFAIHDSFPDKRVASFCEWKRDKMLAGSKGLYEVDVKNNQVVSFKRKDAIPAERLIYCMKQDKAGYVWMGTDDGIYRYDPVKEEALFFDQSDHVQSQAFNSDAAFLSSTGLLFMGGKNGVNYFDPSAFIPPKTYLCPMIASFSINGNDSDYYLASSLRSIPYNSRNIDFIISAPEFKKPFRIKYRYRLKSGDNGWTYMGFNNRVHISKLQPGSYNLEVSASYDGNNWYDSGAVLPFSILKPWWQTWWFRGLCAATIALAIWTLIEYRRKRREAKELKRTIEYFTYSGSADSSPELILWDIARNCIARLGLEDCVIYLLDEERNVLVQKAAYGDKNPQAFEIANPIEIPVGKGITGHVAATKRPVLINDTSKDSRYIIDDEKRFSELAVPIIHEGRLIGVIDSENRKRNFFTKHHLKTLQTISSLCASKIATGIALQAAKKAETELLLLNGKMMESKFMNLRLQMNPHFLFNILTSIQYLIVSNQVNKATNYLNIFAGFLRSLLNFAEDSVVTLEEELRILGMYVELESLCLDESFVWKTEIDEDVDKEEALVPFMLLQPFVENAINHGLIHKIGEKRFTIRIKENAEDSLLCIIEDNGIGRTAAAVIKQKNLSNVIHESKAIRIVEERLEILQQKTSKKAGFVIEDLYENDKASGTRVSITIPNYTKEET